MVALFYSCAECQYAKCRYAEYHYDSGRIFYCYAECHYAKCRYAKCRYAECRSANILSASIVAPCKRNQYRYRFRENNFNTLGIRRSPRSYGRTLVLGTKHFED